MHIHMHMPGICTPTFHLQKVNATTELTGLAADIDEIHNNFKV